MKKTIKLVAIFLILIAMTNSVFAASTDIEVTADFAGTASDKVKEVSGSIWATVATIVQILAVGAIVGSGLTYMFSSADKKADIKKSTMTLAIGAGLVFASTTIVRFIADIGEEVL